MSEIIALSVLVGVGIIAFLIYWVNSVRLEIEEIGVIIGRNCTILDPDTGQRRLFGYKIVKGPKRVYVSPVLEEIRIVKRELNTTELKVSVKSKSELPIELDIECMWMIDTRHDASLHNTMGEWVDGRLEPAIIE
jgi:hypothetical protein